MSALIAICCKNQPAKLGNSVGFYSFEYREHPVFNRCMNGLIFNVFYADHQPKLMVRKIEFHFMEGQWKSATKTLVNNNMLFKSLRNTIILCHWRQCSREEFDQIVAIISSNGIGIKASQKRICWRWNTTGRITRGLLSICGTLAGPVLLNLAIMGPICIMML